MLVRPATIADLPGILEIYNEVVATSTAIYALQASTLDERRAWMDERADLGYPVLVAADKKKILGYSSFTDWRSAWGGYRFTIEHSVHVHVDARGRGIGAKLVKALFPFALHLGKHVMIGAIDAANAGSIRFHERLGFTRVAEFHEVGHKFGRWLDLAFMQRLLDEPGAPRKN